MADFSEVKEGECLRKLKPAGLEINASHTFVLQSVINEIKAHGRSSMHHEVCGVLLGNLCFDKEPYLLIDARIEGKFATHQSGSVTFTSETWDYINEERDSKYPEKKIVGWYHTHPGFGIFLSNMDAFIHNNFFSLKWEPAYVFDPQAETDGFFFSNCGSLLQEEVVVVPNESPVVVEPQVVVRGEKIEILTEEEENRQSSHRFAVIMLSTILLLFLIVTVFGYFIVRDKMATSQKTVDERTRYASSLEDKGQKLAGENGRLKVEGQRLAGENGRLKAEEQKLVGENGKLRAEGQKLAGENERLKGEGQKLNLRISELMGELHALQDLSASLKGQVAELDARLANEKEACRRYMQLLQKASADAKEKERSSGEYLGQIKALKTRIKELEDDNSRMYEVLRSVERDKAAATEGKSWFIFW